MLALLCAGCSASVALGRPLRVDCPMSVTLHRSLCVGHFTSVGLRWLLCLILVALLYVGCSVVLIPNKKKLLSKNQFNLPFNPVTKVQHLTSNPCSMTKCKKINTSQTPNFPFHQRKTSQFEAAAHPKLRRNSSTVR